MMSGQSVVDRLTSAKYTLTGHGLAKSICKATTEEIIGPKKKHIDYLLHCTNEPNVSIPQMADLLIERTQHQNWVVVFKSLISIHNLMNYGNERFTQYLASNNCSFNLGNFMDKTTVQGYDMSTFIRRYAKYLNEKAISYRAMAFDFCKVKRGKDDGLLRTMNGDKLLKTLPTLQSQLDALLEFEASSNELTNGVINACFMLMFKDLIRLFACYNDGIINLLEKFFEMNKKSCREALDIYKKFLVRMEKVSEFLKVAETVGIDRGDIPDLAKAPSSLLDALEQHVQSLEAVKKGGPPPSKPASVASAIKSLSNGTVTGNDDVSISDVEKHKILEEENKRLQQLKELKEQEQYKAPSAAPAASTNPFASDVTTSPSSGQPPNQPQKQESIDLFGGDIFSSTPTSQPQQNNKLSNDLLSLSGPNPFSQGMQNVLAVNEAVHQQKSPSPQNVFGAPAVSSWGQGFDDTMMDPLAPPGGATTNPFSAGSGYYYLTGNN